VGGLAQLVPEVYSSTVHMKRAVSIVDARRDLGRLADEVRRTGRPILLTRRGRPVASITPEPAAGMPQGKKADAFAAVRGTVHLRCSFDELQRAVRRLRGEFSRNLTRRTPGQTRARRGG